MITAAQQGSDSFTVTTATGQVVATAVSLIPAATPLAILANGVVSYMYAFRISGDFDQNNFNSGDVINLIGAASGLALAITVIVPASPIAVTTLAAVSISANFASIWNSSNIAYIKDVVGGLFNQTFAQNPNYIYTNLYIAPDATFATRMELITHHGDRCYVLKTDSPLNPLTAQVMDFVDAYRSFTHWDQAGYPVYIYAGGPYNPGSGPIWPDPVLYFDCSDFCDQWVNDGHDGWSCMAAAC